MRPLLMITNDDGIHSPGLLSAVRAARRFGEVIVAAPITQQTAMGRAYPRAPDLGIIERVPLKVDGEEIVGYGVHGSPAYAAAFGILELAGRKPDLCISGINYGGNMGTSLTCSGTIGAALESDSEDVPALAVSLETEVSEVLKRQYNENLSFESAEEITAYWIGRILREGMPRQCSILNVNVPDREIGPEEYRWTRLARHNYYVLEKPAVRDWSKPCTLSYSLAIDLAKLDRESDVYAVCGDRITSVTPLTWDLTLR